MVQKMRRKPKILLWTEKWFTDWWGLEIISWFFAALSIAAIIITLSIHSGKTLPNWPFGITLNAMISVFATIGEIFMMKAVSECLSQLKWLWFTRKRPLDQFQAFDDASRGSIGSLKLFWKLRGLHLALMGAVITSIGMAFGPFTQQVLTYPSRPREVGTATTPQVLTYLVNSTVSGINPDMFSAIFGGLSDAGASLSSVPTTCNTGNCSWSLYPSLEVCANVVDVSESLTTNFCNSTIYNEFLNASEAAQTVFRVPCFNYTLNGRDGINISFAYVTPDLNSNTESITTQLYQGPKDKTLNGTALLDFYLLHQPLINSSSTAPVALECTLGFCVQTYETSVYSSNTTTLMKSYKYLEVDERAEGLPSVNATVGDVNFVVQAYASEDIAFLLSPTFTGSCQAFFSPSEFRNDFSCNGSDTAEAFGTAVNQTSGFASDVKDAVEVLLNNTAISITNAMRQGVGGVNTVIQVNGTAYSMETYVQAQYLWLVFPIGLISITLIFLIATMLKSQRAKTNVWKSSSFPVLQGLDHTLHGELGGLYTMDEVEIKSKGLEVKLEMGKDKSWSLVRS